MPWRRSESWSNIDREVRDWPAYGPTSASANSPSVERAQVLDRLPDPDQLDRDPELGADRQGDSALGGAVELGQDDPGEVDGLAEDLRLAQAVLAGRRVDDDQRLGRRLAELLGDHPVDLGELVHQIRAGVEATGGVGEDHVDPARLPGLDRVEEDGARVLAGLRLDDLAARALGPGRELLDRGGAVGVAGGEQHRQAGLLLQVPGELADRRRLAGAVDADDQDQRRPLLDVEADAVAAAELGEQLDQPGADCVTALELAALDLGLEPADDVGGRPGADVGHDQGLLKPFERLGVERLEQARADLGSERLAARPQALAQAPEYAAAEFVPGGLPYVPGRRCSAVAEVKQLVPARRHPQAGYPSRAAAPGEGDVRSPSSSRPSSRRRRGHRRRPWSASGG